MATHRNGPPMPSWGEGEPQRGSDYSVLKNQG